ncbi:MAG: 50S ribosomal protein L11 methyltransferase [Candidatus Desulforudis sp.]|nr:50S ribosomal protein L11 methyltransferase [Desulforudis sp.]
MYWLEIDVHTPDQFRDAVSNVFFEMGSGVEEPASSNLGISIIRGYFPADDRGGRMVRELQRRVAHILGEKPRIEVRRLTGRDWTISWREGFKPFRVGERLVVKPTWEKYEPGPDDLVIELDPGLAFGCGSHATTGMCLELLERHVQPGMAVLDVGTGSGILAVGAALLGARTVWAVDEDPVAVRTARENVVQNNLAGRVWVYESNLLEDLAEPADLVVANIVAEVLVALCPAAATVLEPGGRFILSGILDRREEMVRQALVAEDFEVRGRMAEGEWVALVGVKR